jgi:hypothetical protein
MPSKKLLPGVDFALPEPIASVLPRIELTGAETDELWALTQKGRRCDPNNDDDAALFKESALKTAVEWALQFYVRDVSFRVKLPPFRRHLEVLRKEVDRLRKKLPQEHDPVGYFLKRTYTREVFLADHLRPTDEQLAQRKEAWSAKHGFDAIRNSLSESQRNIDCAASLLSGTKPPNVAVNSFVLRLAHAWKEATGCWPKSGRDYNASHQSGPFADFVTAANKMLPRNYHIPRLDHAIRSVCARETAAESEAYLGEI